MAGFLLQEKQRQNRFREKSQKAQTCLNIRLPQIAHSNLNITASSGWQPRSRRTRLQELLLSRTQSVHCQFASWKMTTRQKNPISFWYCHIPETQKGSGIMQHALKRRWLLFHPLTSHSPEPCIPLLSQSFSLYVWQSSLTVKQVLTWFFPIQYIKEVNFLVTPFN